MRRALAIGFAIATLPLAGCGSDDAAPSSPATLVPAEAQLYLEQVTRPQGSQREALESSLSLLLDTEDPGALIVEEVNRLSAEEGSKITYEGDVEPWLGERGAFFVTDFFAAGEEGRPENDDVEDAAFVVDATDDEAAQAFIDKAAEEEGPSTEESYEGVDYVLIEDEDDADDPTAGGVVGDHVVLGTEEAFRQVVDTEAGAAPLADDESFTATVDGPDEATTTLYVDAPAILADAESAGELSRSDREALDVLGGIAEAPLAATLDVETTGFGLDLSHGASELPFLGAPRESALLRELPGDAWLAAGFSDIGGAVGSFLDQADEFGIPGVELEAARRQFERDYGLPLEEFYAPLGDGALFASGRGIFGTGGGLVVEAESPAAAARVIRALRGAAQRSGEDIGPPSAAGADAEGFSITIPDAPGAINFLAAGERLVIAYGDAAAAPLEESQTLAQSEEFAVASDALGDGLGVGFYLDFGPIAELLDLAAGADPALGEALPYLEAIDFVIAGSASEGDRERQRLFIGLTESISGPPT